MLGIKEHTTNKTERLHSVNQPFLKPPYSTRTLLCFFVPFPTPTPCWSTAARDLSKKKRNKTIAKCLWVIEQGVPCPEAPFVVRKTDSSGSEKIQAGGC